MTTAQIIILGLSEAVALVFVARLWLKRRRLPVAARLFWSAVLLIPVLGLVFYGFCMNTPDVHPYDTDTTRNEAETFTDGRL